jgi:murein DD-endopeptidase MepM/ murein hydrolase activator NlpD
VLGATGAAYLGTAGQVGPDAAQAAYSVPVQPLSSDQVASADAQSSADAADAASIEALEEQAAAADAARELAARQAAAAQALAAEQAAAEARAERRRQAAEEQASRDALRDPRGVARVLVAEKGWNSEQFSCLDSLWTKESGWKHTADNPTSSAYGIPQALPGSKMSSFGDDWATNPVTQITWGLHYIDTVYGTPCSAWAHSRSHNWY